MAYIGYFALGGNEIINVQRTEAYAQHAGSTWFRPVYKNKAIGSVLGDAEYRSAFQDEDVPWTDPDDPASYGFYGLYPLDITGIDDSTRTSVVTENTTDGGNVGRLRHGTRSMVFSAMLLGQDERSVESGLRWLRSVLLSGSNGPCDSGNCTGTTMCYFNSEPAYDDSCGPCEDYLRYLYRVAVNVGPIVTEKKKLSDGACIWTVTFTVVAGIPFEFGDEVPLVGNWPARWDPTHSYPLTVADGVTADRNGYVSTEQSCPAPTYTPVFDPGCPDLILPPVAPPIPLGCYNPPVNWRRRKLTIDADLIPLWTDMVPLIKVKARDEHVRNLRIRIFPEGVDPDVHYCGFCADFLISYSPEGSTMVIDGRDETVEVTTPGQTRRADGLVFGSNHMPFVWPKLSCGIGYTVVMDALQTQVMPFVDISLVPRAR